MPSPNSKKVYTYKHRGRVYPTLGFTLQLHDSILEASGGLAGVKDESGLLSALDAPVRSVGGRDAYPTFLDKVSALGYFVARNHAFSDGNKRTSLLLMTQTLEWNNYYLQWSEDAEVIVVTLLGAGHLSIEGLKFALALACGLDPSDPQL